MGKCSQTNIVLCMLTIIMMGEVLVFLDAANTSKGDLPHFVLVHGISHGCWCWYKMRSLLEKKGYKVSCIDLKGAGKDPTDPNTVLTFKDYNKPLIDFLSSLDPNEQVILVGHSAGGLSLTDAIIKFGKKKIKLAIFVAATMLKAGYLTDQDIKDGVPDLSEFGTLNQVYDIGYGLGKGSPPTSLLVKKELQRKIFYQLSPIADSNLASNLLRPGPIMAIKNAKFAYTKDEEEVPRIYIKTAHDNVVKPMQQEAMIKKWPPSNISVVQSDHSPFFSTPVPLFDAFVKAVASFE